MMTDNNHAIINLDHDHNHNHIIVHFLLQIPKRRAGRKDFVHLSKMITENDHGTTNLEHNHNHNCMYIPVYILYWTNPALIVFENLQFTKSMSRIILKEGLQKLFLAGNSSKKRVKFHWYTYYGYDFSTSLNTLRIGRSSFTILFFWKSGNVELFQRFMCQIKILYSPASSLRRKLVFQSWQQFPPHAAFSLDSSSIQHQAFWGWMQNIQFVYESEGLLFLSDSTGDECQIFYFSETLKSDAGKARASPYWRLFPWICGLCENGFSKHLNLFRAAHIGVGLEP